MTTTISDLPNELLAEILSFLSTCHLPALCCTSKNLNILATSLLYRAINPRTPVQAIHCFHTIIARRQAALAVRRFSNPFSDLELSISFFELSATAIRHCAPFIEFLEVSSWSSLVFLYLNKTDTTLPNLVKCSLPYSPHPLTFLARHAHSLASLYFCPDDSHFIAFQAWPHPDSMIRTYFPHLTSLDCHGICIASLLPPFALLERANVHWHDSDGDGDDEETDAQHILRLLEAPTLRSMVNSMLRRDNTPLMRAFALAARSASISTLTSLTFHVLHLNEEFMADLVTSLSAFRTLVRLSVYTTPTPQFTPFDDIDRELKCVTRWGEACPTLRRCTSPSGITWRWLPIECWVPLADLVDKVEWMMRAIATGKYAFLDKVNLDILEQREEVV